MKRPLAFGLAIAGVLLSADEAVSATGPTTAECLAASEASLASATAHKLRSERAQLILCAAAGCPAVIRKECLSHVDEVNAQIPTIIFAAQDASGADIGAVTVSMDGERLTDRLDGAALPVDPGEHVFTFETQGRMRVTKKLVVQEAVKERHELITFEPAPLATPSQKATARPGLGAQKVTALVAGSVGVVGLGIGAAFGALALSQKSEAQNACPGATCSTQSGGTKWSDATTSGNVSTVALIVGAVGVGAGLVLWFTAPHAHPGPSTQLGVGPGVFQLKGTW